MKKVTIKQAKGTGILSLMADGRYQIEVNGQSGSSLYYTKEQVEKIIKTSKEAGYEVIIED